MVDVDVAKLDLYGLLSVEFNATDKEIVKAYRKAALKCHPDKNPDNPKAAEQFLQLSKALEVLTDVQARAAYDQILKGKKAAELRHRELNSKRKRFKEDLEARENAFETKRATDVKATRNLQEEIARLRKEGSKLLEEEQERLRTELRNEKLRDQTGSNDDPHTDHAIRLKIKWKVRKDDPENGGYSESSLRTMFEKYGDITGLIVSKKKRGNAVLEYELVHSALRAVQHEVGFEDNPLTLTWLSGQPAGDSSSVSTKSSDPTHYKWTSTETMRNLSMSAPTLDVDYESIVLMKMRQAEERRKLIEQMQSEDDDD